MRITMMFIVAAVTIACPALANRPIRGKRNSGALHVRQMSAAALRQSGRAVLRP